MFGAVRLGLKAWEKGEKDTELMHRVRIVKSLIKRQISSMSTAKLLDSDLSSKQVAYILKGAENSVEFISNYSISPDNEIIPVYVKYYVDSKDHDNLVVLESPILTLHYQNLQDAVGIDKGKNNSHVLLEDVHDVMFEYLNRRGDGSSGWQDFWNTGLNKPVGFPAAIKITFSLEEIPFSLVVKIMSDYEIPGRVKK